MIDARVNDMNSIYDGFGSVQTEDYHEAYGAVALASLLVNWPASHAEALIWVPEETVDIDDELNADQLSV
jgi:hypothetical protein